MIDLVTQCRLVAYKTLVFGLQCRLHEFQGKVLNILLMTNISGKQVECEMSTVILYSMLYLYPPQTVFVGVYCFHVVRPSATFWFFNI